MIAAVTLRRVRAPEREAVDAHVVPAADAAPFVHYGWFWVDRAAADPTIRTHWIRRGDQAVGLIAFGPHEPVDLDPTSRIPGVGEVYHVVIDHKAARDGLGRAAMRLAARRLARALRPLKALIVCCSPDNRGALAFYDRLGFRDAGRRADGETGEEDVVLRLDGAGLTALLSRGA